LAPHISSACIDSINVDEALTVRAVHAALGDPARLAIVDTLVLGEASPSELQQLLDMPSNLMAHHVRVLEKAGVVTRHRSEGDRRRTYLAPAPAALDALRPRVTREAVRVVFVCTENSARSQLAAALVLTVRTGRGSPASSRS
jgi:DNA-binding transcriptional ArsR family regulator